MQPSELTKNQELNFALEAVYKAALLVRGIQEGWTASSIAKDDNSPVTIADFAGQAVVGRMLHEAFPEAVMIGEEQSGILKTCDPAILEEIVRYVCRAFPDADAGRVCRWIDRGAGVPCDRFWTLDPVDGTKGFIRGEQYAVALALIEKKEVQLGVIGCPHIAPDGTPNLSREGSIVFAVKGKGTWLSPLKKPFVFKRLSVSEHRDPSQMQVLRSVVAAHTHSGRTESFLKKFPDLKPPVFMDSQAKYAVVASGKGDAFFYLVPEDRPDYRMKIWDVAAGSLVVEEAGGRASDLKGNTLDFSAGLTLARNPGIVITNGKLHSQVLKALKEVLLKQN